MDVQTPEAPSELFRDWQRTQTQSSATADTARDSKWMSGSAISRNHRREAHRRAVNLVYEFLRAPPQRASGDVCFLLTTSMARGAHSRGNENGCHSPVE